MKEVLVSWGDRVIRNKIWTRCNDAVAEFECPCCTHMVTIEYLDGGAIPLNSKCNNCGLLYTVDTSRIRIRK